MKVVLEMAIDTINDYDRTMDVAEIIEALRTRPTSWRLSSGRASAGDDVVTIYKALGHSSIATTARHLTIYPTTRPSLPWPRWS